MIFNRIYALRRPALAGLALLALPVMAPASVTLDVSAGSLKDAAGQPIPRQALVLLVASLNGDFEGPVAGAFTGPGERVLFRADGSGLGDFGEPGFISFYAAMLELGDGWQTGQWLALYWYPELTLDSNAPPAGSQYGRFAPASQATPDGGQPWVTPGDGSSISLRFFTEDFMPGAGHPPTSGQALFTVGNSGGNGGGTVPVLPGELTLSPVRTHAHGWHLNATLGWVNTSHAPWAFAPSLGYFRVFGTDESAMWLYTADDGWLWTGTDFYPYFYHWEGHRWRYLHTNADATQWFEYLPAQGWILIPET